MNIAFYIKNSVYDRHINLSNLYDGNPGIGGTEYVMLLTAHLLTVRDNGLYVTVYVEQECKFPNELNVVQISNIESAAEDAAKNSCKRFIFDCKWIDWEKQPFHTLPFTMKLIPWLHTPIRIDKLHLICKHVNFGRLICVGREACDLYRDDWTFELTDYIFNCVPQQNLKKYTTFIPFEKRGHIVTYVGSLTPRKTFHVLAEIWPNVLRHVPDAELYVIGAASLYDNVIEFGEYHIAEKSYEKLIMSFLQKNEKVYSSVHFIGSLGVEKNEILSITKVGVPNPTGKTETFCLSAVEMQLYGCAVTAMQAPGYYDTFYNGKIVKQNKDSLVKSIVDLLNANIPPKTYSDTRKYMCDNFSETAVAEKWELLLHSDLTKHINNTGPLKNGCYRLKWLKELFRNIKSLFPKLKYITLPIEKIVIRYEKTKDEAYRFY